LYSTMWWCSTKLRWWLLLSFVLLCIMPLLSIGLDRLHKIGHVLIFVDKGCFVTIRLCFTSVAHLIATACCRNLGIPWHQGRDYPWAWRSLISDSMSDVAL
jgi:hypothetical protein